MKRIGWLIFGILIVDLYFIYNHVVSIQEKSYQVLKVDSEVVQELYAKLNPSEDANVLKGLYGNDSVSNSYMVSVGISNYIKENHLQSPEYISERDVERSIRFIFGYDVVLQHEDALLLSDEICGYHYDEFLNRYENLGECDRNVQESFYREVIAAEQTGDWLLITEKSVYVYDDFDDIMSRKFVYNSVDREKVLDYIETTSLSPASISLDKYFDDASTYVYYFHLKNGEYIFEGMKRTN